MGVEAQELRVLNAPDYAPNEQVEHRMKLLQHEIQRLVPNRLIKMLRAEGPFVDDYDDAAWIEGDDKNRLPADKLVTIILTGAGFKVDANFYLNEIYAQPRAPLYLKMWLLD